MSGLGRRGFLGLAGAFPALALGVGGKRHWQWKMVTSWPKNSPGPGRSAERLARRLERASGGRLQVKVFGAGELVPALEVFDAVSRGTAELGHTAALFWAGKLPLSPFFTAVPFGLTPGEHAAWIYHGGGQRLWERLYAPFGIQPYMAGNTGMGMGGWFKQEIQGLQDLQGLKVRMPGLGGEVYRRLGALPVVLPPGEIYTALNTGVVDGAEFVGPWSDLALGLHQAAAYYYWPGFHEPNGTGECLVNREALAELPDDLQALLADACAAEHAQALAESRWFHGEALNTLVNEHGIQLRAFPESVLTAAREASEAVLAELAGENTLAGEIHQSFQAARDRLMDWSRVSLRAFLDARPA